VLLGARRAVTAVRTVGGTPVVVSGRDPSYVDRWHPFTGERVGEPVRVRGLAVTAVSGVAATEGLALHRNVHTLRRV